MTLRSGTVVPAFEGRQYVELDSDFQVTPNPGQGSNSAMAAFMSLVQGQTYELSFAYRPRTNRGGDNGIRVELGALTDLGQGSRSFSVSKLVGAADATTGMQNFWQVLTFTFKAGAGDNALMFTAFGLENELGGFLDAIEVSEASAVPAPAAGLLMLAGLAAFRRRCA